jgi:FkbH-like protein
VEANWGPKSESVGRILRTWNIGPEAVVFVDDSPMELAEVAAAFPQVTCLRFPREDPAGVVDLMARLRDLCGRRQVSREDQLRRESLEQGQKFQAEAGAGDTEQFLASLQARLVFEDGARDRRALELVNKTNQFNLHGRRYGEDEWRALVARPEAFVWTVSYEDRFGALGKIAVLAGEKKGQEVRVRDMVLSCRAFSRRVEYAALRHLTEALEAASLEVDYAPTAKNGPLREFLAAVAGPLPVQGPVKIAPEALKAAPSLYQEIVDNRHG